MLDQVSLNCKCFIRQYLKVDICVLIYFEDLHSIGSPGELVTRSPRLIQGSVRTEDTFLLPGEYIIQVLSFSKFAECKIVPGTVVIHR